MTTDQLAAEDRANRPETSPLRKRPIAVWVIFIVYVLSAALAALSLYLFYGVAAALNVAPALDGAKAAYLSHLRTVDYASLVSGLLNLAGAITLLRLRRPAPFLFTTALAVAIIFLGREFAEGWLNTISGSGLIRIAIGLAIDACVCIYSWKLLKVGTLR
jgi:hypothetical protein